MTRSKKLLFQIPVVVAVLGVGVAWKAGAGEWFHPTGIDRELPQESADWSSTQCQPPRLRTPGYGDDASAKDEMVGCELYVVRVQEVRDEGATRNRPPRVRLAVEEVLRGPARTEPIPAVFTPEMGKMRCGTSVLADRAAGVPAEHVAGPPVGARLIVAGGWNARQSWFEVHGERVWAYGDAKRTELLKLAQATPAVR
ncbi:hypothetical protein DRW03_19290 [Corallococcus sp. H22C18031201]|uniref:hypothetical protein n=1 Tax=Citreicoccus inhibens TaxID=2849499 RepID=UPI000E757F89|nr:hypothetical protein [Citreicoccus inhibens]MBU8896928.1 hypothetical protein [Citreicoccus inhibens]RJS20820.1 hypothetical protein DRW03_19290 [Corallococcus sp. H22C18031201]